MGCVVHALCSALVAGHVTDWLITAALTGFSMLTIYGYKLSPQRDVIAVIEIPGTTFALYAAD